MVTNMQGSLNYRVVHANPPREFITIRGDNGSQRFTVSNQEVFDHLHNDYTLADLDTLIPPTGERWVFLGVLFDIEISIDYHGRFQFGGDPHEKVEMEEPKCDHGFVVRDIQGDNRFLCRECDARFPRHPSLLERVEFKVADTTIANSLSMFRDGMETFTEAAKRTNLSLDAFKQSLKRLFPPKANVEFFSYSLGSNQPIGKVTSVEEQRTSCPKEIEDYFANQNSTCLTPGSWGFPFNDVTEVSSHKDLTTNQIIFSIEFVDGTIQKVTRLSFILSKFLPHRPTFDYGGEF